MKTNHKKVLQYPAVFTHDQKGGYNVSFPDLPGCVTFGRTLEEAKKKAMEVLELWLEELQDKGETVPQATFDPIVDQVSVSLTAI